MALIVRIKPRAQREIERAAEWWTENRLAARGAVRQDLEAAVALLVEEPGIGTKVETSRADVVRRLYLSRIRYFVYYPRSRQVSESGRVLAFQPRRWSFHLTR